jgi:hypothetical protein
MKLEHAKHYLGTGLKVKASIHPHYSNYEIESDLVGITTRNRAILQCYDYDNNEWDTLNLESLDNIKPILYPLDLTKPIWFEGKEIVPIDEIQKLHPHKAIIADMIYYVKESGQFMMNTHRDGEVSINIMRRIDEKLHQWRMDVFELIPQDLAISVHDVDSEIYKTN